MKSIALFVLLAATLVSAEVVVLSEKPLEQNFPGYRSVIAKNQTELNAFSEMSKTRVGIFPALVDTTRGIWVAINGNLAEAEIALKAKTQSVKPQKQKILENRFFSLSEELLVMIEDPRAGQTPPIKLTMDELTEALGDFLETGNPGQQRKAIKLSVRLLSTDSTLLRYDEFWWDKATQHVLDPI